MSDAIWGYDKDGDFALKLDDRLYVFYKWSDPTILMGKEAEGFVALTDANSKEVWAKVRKY